MRRHPALLALLTLLLLAAPAKAAPHRSVATLIRGGYANELGFVPTSVAPSPQPNVLQVTFTGGSLWDGDLTGHTVVQGSALMDATTGAMKGTYTETFYGTYVLDHRTGTLVTKGVFGTTEQETFFARARIVSGTCGFAGSTGVMAYDGASIHGGYVGTWRHPAGPPPSGPCTG